MPQFLAACYKGDPKGILFTTEAEDACSYASFEKAVTVAREIQTTVGFNAVITVVDY